MLFASSRTQRPTQGQRSGGVAKMIAHDRNGEVVKSYKSFVVKAWMSYLVDQHDFTPPAWLNMQLMGSVKIGGAFMCSNKLL